MEAHISLASLNKKVKTQGQDLDGISGKTPEEKVAAHRAFAKFRKFAHLTEGWKYMLPVAPVVSACVMYVLDHLGVDTRQLGPVINEIIKPLLGLLS